MNRRLVSALVVAVGVLAAPSQAAAVPLGEADGVTLARRGDEWVFRFAPRAAKAYRAIAGRKVKVTCISLEPGSGGYLVTGESSGSPIRVPRRGRTLRTFIGGEDVDLCEIERRSNSIALVPGTDDGRTYLDEGRTFGLMLFPLFTFDDDASDTPLTTGEAVRRGRGLVVALDGPEGTPPAGKTGYWTDGVTVAIVRLSGAGRRMFVEFGPEDVVRTNVLAYLQEDD